MKKIVFVMIVVFGMAFGAGSAEKTDILPQKAEYKIVQIVINGKVTQATEGAIFGINDTKIYGNTGCNSYFTDFKRVDSENIEVSTNGGATKMMCDMDSMTFENAFLQSLVGKFNVMESSDLVSLKGEKMEVVLK